MSVKPYYNFESEVERLREYISHGLTFGLGQQEPGQGCIEAAVCYVLDLTHGDRPFCVGDTDRAFAFGLNDAPWSSNDARAEGLVDFAIAHLGSYTMSPIKRAQWARHIAEQTVRRVLPIALREAQRCEGEGTTEAVKDAETAAVAMSASAVAAAARAAVARAARAAASSEEEAACAAAWSARAARAAASSEEEAAASVELAVEAIRGTVRTLSSARSAVERMAEGVTSTAKAGAKEIDMLLREAAQIAVEAYALVRDENPEQEQRGEQKQQ